MLVAFGACATILLLLHIVARLHKTLAEEIWPLFYDAQRTRRVGRRRRFADHIENEVRRLTNFDLWSDYRFTELEAEVEAEGRHRVVGIIPFLSFTSRGLRHERSLSRALEVSVERLILLEGEPGPGKSVALRHVAHLLTARARKARRINSVIPIYINLKEIHRSQDSKIDRRLIQAFIIQTLNRVNDIDVELFVEDEFDLGLREGTWFFLFDSFDEIPEILSSTDADDKIRKYAAAIEDFLHGMNRCRGIIASRQFRGPNGFAWPRFRILPLTEARQRELIRKADLDRELEQSLVGQMPTAPQEVRAMASNPLFLGLVCEHVRDEHSFPENTHAVFETYIENRLTRDKQRLQRRFGFGPEEIRTTAENLAFCMAADPGLGLSPNRQDLNSAVSRFALGVNGEFDAELDALEFIKLARSETATTSIGTRPFTFSHRRLQEYFATCVVLREPHRVQPDQLIGNARWRETAVVTCQTQPLDALTPLLEEIRRRLIEINNSITAKDDLLQNAATEEEGDYSGAHSPESHSLPEQFRWPSGSLYMLALLQDGFSSRLAHLPPDIRAEAGKLLLTATRNGTLSDRKWALETAGTVPLPILQYLLRAGFRSSSQWLSEVAYRQASRLVVLPNDIARWIREALVDQAVRGRLAPERESTLAHLARFENAKRFISTTRLLLWAPHIDFGLHVVLMAVTLALFAQAGALPPPLALSLVIATLTSYLVFSPNVARALGGHLFTGATVRIIVGGGLFFAWLVLNGYDLLLLGLSTVYFYVAAWRVLAFYYALQDRFHFPVAWPLIPLLWILGIMLALWPVAIKLLELSIKLRYRRFPIMMLQIWRLTPRIARGTMPLLLSAPFMVGLIFALDYLPSFVLWILLGSFFGTGFLSLISMAAYEGLKHIKDWRLWSNWVRVRDTPINGGDFLEGVGRFSTNAYRSHFVVTVREGALLVATEESEAIVRNLALQVEIDRRLSLGRSKRVITKDHGDPPLRVASSGHLSGFFTLDVCGSLLTPSGWGHLFVAGRALSLAELRSSTAAQ